jgi:putative flippase GtrA
VELALYCLIGASGYVVNLVAFQVAYSAGASHLGAATVAFLVAVTNNYLLNRRWTFARASETAKRVQAPRFLAVSVAAFGVSLAVLELLVRVADAEPFLAQAIAVLIAMPVGFVGQKLWSFRSPALEPVPAES